MSQGTPKNLTLMFVDVASLQTVRANEGEEVAHAFLEQCVGLITSVQGKHNGTKVRTVGGTVLCAFEKVDEALEASVQMHEKMDQGGFHTRTRGLLRMGLHTGDVVLAEGSCSGEVVTTTARMVTLAQPGQTIATGDVRDGAGEKWQNLFSPLTNAGRMEERLGVRLFQVGQTRLAASGDTGTTVPTLDDAPKTGPKASSSKTVPRPQEVMESPTLNRIPAGQPAASGPAGRRRPIVLQEIHKKPAGSQDPKTVVVSRAPKAAAETPNPENLQLCLIWRDHVISVHSDHPVVTLGRDNDNEIVLTVRTASRKHAEIVMRNGVFYLVDHSGNGTFIYDQEGKEHCIEQAEVEIAGSGAICPGSPQEEAGCEALLYWIAER